MADRIIADLSDGEIEELEKRRPIMTMLLAIFRVT
jgi:hypothetical protein